MKKKICAITALLFAFTIAMPLISTAASAPMVASTFDGTLVLNQIVRMFPEADLDVSSSDVVMSKIEKGQLPYSLRLDSEPVQVFTKTIDNGDYYNLEVFADGSYLLVSVTAALTAKGGLLYKVASAATASRKVSATAGGGTLGLWEAHFWIDYRDTDNVILSAYNAGGAIGILGATQGLQIAVTSPSVLNTRKARALFEVMTPVYYQGSVCGYTSIKYYLNSYSSTSGFTSDYTLR
ncbi:MAG: hypothetical protein LBQ19_00495 [Synergistaceae bacterium]|jgi:hypothetical protein|nr:hypothetical protein [Synergistaceae bacterium]